MSISISANDSKFVIFGSGHDYTRVNSGKGEKVFFSHPYVPVGGKNYAGQYLFYVPDEDGVFFDAVKDDIEHCTFTPALGTTFDTEGELTISVLYRREYAHGEETILVEKQLSQIVEVVDHGSITNSYNYNDIFEDGYCYVHPRTQDVSDINNFKPSGSFSKISSIPFRATSLFEMCYGQTTLTDISELEYADTSTVTTIKSAFYNCWGLEDLTPLVFWDTSHLTNMKDAFRVCTGLTSLRGLDIWDTSNVTNMQGVFSACTKLSDISALSRWDTSSVTDMSMMFMQCVELSDLTPLAGWNTGNVTTMEEMFEIYNVSLGSIPSIESLAGLQYWDVSNVTTFHQMFSGQIWLSDVSTLADWDVSSGTDLSNMFYDISALGISALSSWDVSNATTLVGMFGKSFVGYSSDLGKYVYKVNSYYYDKNGNSYTSSEVGTFTPISQNAAGVAGWTVNVASPTQCFDDNPLTATWYNIPSWN